MAITYNDYPKKATENAKKALRWKEEHDAKGCTRVGWARSHQLANREGISQDTIARMASFARHRKNSEIADEYKGTPWKDKGYLCWNAWGGDEGVDWAIRKMKSIRKAQNESVKIYEDSSISTNALKFNKLGTKIEKTVKSNIPMFNHAIKKIDQFLRVYFNEFKDNFYHKFDIKDANGLPNNIDDMGDRAAILIDISKAADTNHDIEVMVLTDPYDNSYDYHIIVDRKVFREVDDFNEFADALDDVKAIEEHLEIEGYSLDEGVAAVTGSTMAGSGPLVVSQPGAIPGQPGNAGNFFGFYPLGFEHVWTKKKGEKNKVTPSGWTQPIKWEEFKNIADKTRVGVSESNDDIHTRIENNLRALDDKEPIKYKPVNEKNENKISFQISDNLKKISRIQKHLIDASQLMTEMTDEIKLLKKNSEKIEQPLDEFLNGIEKNLDLAIDKMRDEKEEGKTVNIQSLIRKVNNKLEDMKDKILESDS